MNMQRDFLFGHQFLPPKGVLSDLLEVFSSDQADPSVLFLP